MKGATGSPSSFSASDWRGGGVRDVRKFDYSLQPTESENFLKILKTIPKIYLHENIEDDI